MIGEKRSKEELRFTGHFQAGKFILAILLLIAVISGIYTYYNPSDDWKYCQRNKPEWNNSGDERADKCFNELWPSYCELRAPRNCPIDPSPLIMPGIQPTAKYNFSQ